MSKRSRSSSPSDLSKTATGLPLSVTMTGPFLVAFTTEQNRRRPRFELQLSQFHLLSGNQQPVAFFHSDGLNLRTVKRRWASNPTYCRQHRLCRQVAQVAMRRPVRLNLCYTFHGAPPRFLGILLFATVRGMESPPHSWNPRTAHYLNATTSRTTAKKASKLMAATSAMVNKRPGEALSCSGS